MEYTAPGILIAFKSQVPRNLGRRADATITQIQVEAGTVSSWWMVTADWLDPQSGRILTFRSRRLKFPPHHQIGEHIAVYFEANEPKHYQMEL
ncbi:MAG TPA: hypothetical protein VKB35_02105 [Ktedonobacteraceae bacterium]|nr:hypothetical protein [Ktedonobacteraceae bacterium]